ncbi:diguanylate cyclase [Agrobacterium vitis]|uniref:sensor domain-containing diguanylate cyclase n=1 Tax=Agrobacterium vitis TaxID=373 RepID=UPI001F1A4971|nr:diguanylate cyclase [Agrobacterium vitis]
MNVMHIASKNPAQQLVIAGGFAIFLALTIWSEVANWTAQVSRMNSYLAQTARAIAQHTDDVIEVAKQPLAGLVFEVQENNSKSVLQSLDLVRRMRELIKTSPYLRSLAYIGPDGRLIESTSDPFSSGLDLSSRSYFKTHQTSAELRPFVDGPYQSPSAKDWFITLSQRMNDDRGQFAGIMVATIDVESFIRFFRSFNMLDNSAFAMMDGAGRVLVRAPLDATAMGTSIADSALYRSVSTSNIGNFQYTSRFDGILRTSGYYRSSNTQITVLVAVSKKSILWYWIDISKPRWICFLVALMVACALGVRLRRQWALKRRDEMIIAAREAEFRLIANVSSDLIEKLDDNGIREYVSAAAKSVLGVEADTIVGRSVLDEYDADARQYWSEALANIAAGSSIERLVFPRIKKDGEISWLETVITRVRSFDVSSGMVAVTRDVTSQRLLQEELDRLANTDELTQLSNKRHFNRQMKSLSAEARMVGTPLSLLVVDVDKFKLFNDTYGHLPGDDCLRKISTEIAAAIRPGTDLAARYGGEEIVILLPGRTASQAHQIGEEIRQRIAALEIIHQKNLPWGHVTVSIGVAEQSAEHDETDEALFVKADQCLYTAKNSGRNKVVSFDENLSVAAA